MKRITIIILCFILLELFLLTMAFYYFNFYSLCLLILFQTCYIVWFTCYQRGLLNKIVYAWLFLGVALSMAFVPDFYWNWLFGIPSFVFFFSTLVDVGTVRS